MFANTHFTILSYYIDTTNILIIIIVIAVVKLHLVHTLLYIILLLHNRLFGGCFEYFRLKQCILGNDGSIHVPQHESYLLETV